MTSDAVDFVEKGDGPAVILIHSSAAGARQWGSLMDALADRFRLIAVNLFGYGKTGHWPCEKPQTLGDHAELVSNVVPEDGARFSLVGHSFGASVAMKTAAQFKGRVHRLVLIEPNPFYLLQAAGRVDAYNEAMALRDCIKENGQKGDWKSAAANFTDYWAGKGTWASMSDDRKERLAVSLQPNFYEWDAVMNADEAPLSRWSTDLPEKTTVVSAADTVRSIREVVELMQEACTNWRFETLAQGGHLTPLTRPELVNPIVDRALT